MGGKKVMPMIHARTYGDLVYRAKRHSWLWRLFHSTKKASYRK
jgi:hypothetical protein